MKNYFFAALNHYRGGQMIHYKLDFYRTSLRVTGNQLAVNRWKFGFIVKQYMSARC